MTSEGLAAAVLDKAPIKIAILDNSVYGMVRQWQTLFYSQHYSQTNLQEVQGGPGTEREHAKPQSQTPGYSDSAGGPVVTDFQTSQTSRPEPARHALSVLVENRPGVLARVAGLFARRAFNINSLSFSSTERADLSRITVTADVEQEPLEQIIKQLNKLLHVLKIVDLEHGNTVERELVLIKVKATDVNRPNLLEIMQMFGVRMVDVHTESLTSEVTGGEDKIEALLNLLHQYGVIELVRSGAVTVTRGPHAFSEKVARSQIQGR